MRVLAGDLGGTKVLLCVAEYDGKAYKILHRQRFVSAAYDDFASVVRTFLASLDNPPRSACFAVAGPVESKPDGGQRAKITNLPWQLDSADLAAQCGLEQVRLLNDFQGVGYGVGLLQADDVLQLQSGQPNLAAPRLVVGAGTGLGAALLIPQSDGAYRVYSSESGHAGFAPENAQQQALWAYLAARHERVTVEHILSGRGLLRLYDFILSQDGGEPDADFAARLHQARQGKGDPAALIGPQGLAAADSPAGKALDLFIDIYASQTANLALSSLPQGGIFIAGGIAPKILPRLREGGFLAAFLSKEPMRALLEKMPLAVVLREDVGLLGAISRA